MDISLISYMVAPKKNLTIGNLAGFFSQIYCFESASPTKTQGFNVSSEMWVLL